MPLALFASIKFSAKFSVKKKNNQSLHSKNLLTVRLANNTHLIIYSCANSMCCTAVPLGFVQSGRRNRKKYIDTDICVDHHWNILIVEIASRNSRSASSHNIRECHWLIDAFLSTQMYLMCMFDRCQRQNADGFVKMDLLLLQFSTRNCNPPINGVCTRN